MAPVSRERLSKFFSLFAPTYVLGTTYTISLAFFESVVFPCIKDRSKLKRCLLVCDRKGFQRATSEATALRGASREYMVAVAPGEATFHPKLWLMVGESHLAILVGSGNLTQSGFMDNAELFEVVELEAGGTGRGIADAAKRFVEGLAGLWGKSPVHSLLVHDTLSDIGSHLSGFLEKLHDDSADDVKLLTSFDGAFLEHFRQLGQGGVVSVASPYFGGSVQGLRSLHDALRPRSLRVFPAIHPDGTVDIPIADVRQIPGASTHSLAIERREGDFAHLKLYGIHADNGDCWLFTGSVNCTMSALHARNVEAGLLRKVSPDVLAAYFASDHSIAVTGELLQQRRDNRLAWLTFCATDLGDSIDVVLTRGQEARLPLKDVHLTLRYGSTRLLVQRPVMFDQGIIARIPWKWFHEGRLSSQAARVLEIDANDCSGQRIHGSALVDDLAALSAEPSHRSAWRAAVALLSSDALPEYADIAALFQLVDEVVTEEGDETESIEADDGRRSPEGSATVATKDKAAVWPPQPIRADHGLLSATSGGRGDLYWFNRILASLVQDPAHNGASDEAPYDDQTEDADTVVEITVTTGILSACARMLKRALESFSTVREWLHGLEIRTDKAHKIWGPATFIFLSTLGTKKAVERTAPGETDSPTTISLIRAYLDILFTDRDQGDDYSPPRSSRYEHAVFPAVAVDLAKTFKVHPHCEICSIVTVAFAQLHAVQRKSNQRWFTLNQWLLFRLVSGDHLSLAQQDPDHLEHIWRRYFDDGQCGLTWDMVAESLAAIARLVWRNHPGFQDLQLLRELSHRADCRSIGTLPEHLSDIELCRRHRWHGGPVDRFTESCVNPSCPRHSREDPRFRVLKDFRPVICGACGWLLIPAELLDAYRESQDG